MATSKKLSLMGVLGFAMAVATIASANDTAAGTALRRAHSDAAWSFRTVFNPSVDKSELSRLAIQP